MQYLRRIERTLPVTAPVTLHVINERGDVAVIGEDRDQIALVAQLVLDARDEASGRARLDAIDVPVRMTGATVTVGPVTPAFDEDELRIDDDLRAAGETFPFFNFRFGSGGIVAAARRVIGEGDLRVNLELRVPRQCVVDIEQRSGTLRVEGLRGCVDARSRSARAEVRDIDGDVSLETRSGHAVLHAIRGATSVESRSGRLELSAVGGDVEVDSRSGRVEVRDVDGRARVRTHAGSVRVEDVRGALTIDGDSGSVECTGEIHAPVTIEVESGSVRLAVPASARFYLDAASELGSVRSDLPVGEREPPSDPSSAPVVRVRTRTGSVRIVPL